MESLKWTKPLQPTKLWELGPRWTALPIYRMMTSSAGRGAPVKRVDDSLLKSGVAIMPGGEDQLGRPLVAFPTTTPEMLRQRHTTAHLVLLLRYYVTLTDVTTRHGGMAVIANLTTYGAKDGLQMVVDALDKLQSEICGSVGVLYVILPRSKDAQKTLKKLLGLKPSKKHPKIPTYEAVLLETVADLQRHIQRRHLTSDFGGTMTYNHRIWVQLTQDVEDLQESVTSALHRVPDAVDKVTMMSEYDLPASPSESEALLLQVRSKYNDIMRHINLEHLIDECKSLQDKLSAPHKHEGYNDITHTVTFTDAKVKVIDYRNRLVQARENLKSLWQQAEGRVMLASKVNKYKVKAEKVTEWMQGVGLPTVNQDPDIADCLSKAEILKNHFETGFLAIAKNVLCLAERILKKFEHVLQECGPIKPFSSTSSSPRGTHQVQTAAVLAYTRQFQATVEYFKRAVEKKHQVYLNVHAFFLSAVKASSVDKETSLVIYRQLQKLTKWYRRTLKFLPVQLLIPASRVAGPRPTSASPYVSSAWRAAIQDFLLHHPLPPADSLTKMKNVIPVIDNIGIRNQARLLIARITLIRSLLVTPDHLSLHDLQDVLLWREQVTKGQDEIYLNMITSTRDLSCLTDSAYNKHVNQGNLRERQWHMEAKSESTLFIDSASMRTPKLCLNAGNEKMYFDEQLAEHPNHGIAHSKKHVHLASIKKGRNKDQQDSVRYLQSEHNIHAVGQSHAPPGVPRLDLRGLKSPVTQKSHTDRDQIFKRQPSFGIYGHVDDPKKVVHRRRTGRCVQNLAPILNSNDNGTEAQQADKELYVSLGGAETSPGSLRLPVSLKHIDIHAFKKNLPQANEHENETIPTTSLSYNGEHRNGRPHSYESLVDSGIAHTQSSAEGSGVSDSTNGLSPSLSVGHGRMDTLLEDNEQDPEQSHEHWAQGHDPRIRSHGPKVQGHGHMGHDQQGHSTHQSHNHKGQSQVANGLSHSPLHQAQSLQNLSYELNGRLSLTQKNIDIIVNSLLPAEEKLKLMVTMCECEGMHNRRAVADAVNALPLRKDSIKRASEVQENNIEPELQHQGGTMSSRLADVLSDSYLQNSSLRSSQGDVTAQNVSGSHSSRARTPKLTGAKLFESHSASPHPEQLGLSLKDSLEPQKYHIIHQNQVNPQQHHIIHQTQVHHQQHNIIHQNQDLTTNVPQIQNGRQPGPTEALLLAQHEDVFGGHVAHENYSVLGNDVHDAGLGIDIEAWMMNQEDGSSEVLLTELAESDQTVDGMSEYVEKWKHARENRQSDEEELSKAARAALKDLSVQEEQLKQQAVERSLTRTQQLLQKQEEHLQKKQIHMTAAADEVPVSSECSLSSGTSAAAVGVTGSFSSDSLPHPSASIHLQENTFCHSSGSSSPPRDVYDSSVSGESGVFTLNSSDTRLIKAAHADMAYSGGSSPRVHKGLSSSAGAVLIPQAELLQGRAALAKSFNGRDAASSKSGILKQMDFRDMLKSISAECNVDDDDGQEEEEEEEEEKDQKVENKEEEEEMGHDDGLHCEEFKEVMQIALDNNLSRSDIDVAIEQCQPIPVLCRLPDSGMNMNGSFNECPGKVMVKETTHGLQKSIPAYSDSDMSDDVFSSDNSTPVNSPRTSSLSQSLKKWDSLNLLEIQEDKLSKPQKDLNENFAGEDGLLTTNTIDIELNACNTVLVGEELVHNSKCVTTNIIPKTMHDNTPTKVHDTRIRSMSDGLEITEFADMKVKVAAGGGSAWANAIPITSYSMEFANLKTPVIIDNGSGLCKCGFADQDLPSAIFPALVGRAKYEDVSMGRMEEHYVGAAAQSMRGVLKLQHPLEHGIITDWNGMELIWQHAFEEQLRVDPSEHPVLVTEAPLNPKKNREHMMELLFETFQVPGVYFAIQAVLSLYASGRTTGMVVDSGDGVSHFVPIYEGYSLPHAIQRLDVAGRDLTQYMAKLLYEKGHSFTSTAETEIVRDMKEKHCYITQDYCADMQRAETSSDMEELYMLPDGQYISLTAERFRCPEVLFDPTMIGHEHGGVHVSAYKSIMKCDLDLREQLFSNIVLSGGTTMLPGFGERLQEEVTALAPSGVAGSVRVTSPEDRYFSVWQGGAVLASLPTFQDCWVSFEEYIDVGANVVHLKCF